MTDLEAIRQYKGAEGDRNAILKIWTPWIFARDSKALEKYRAILQRGLDQAEIVMRQAERAVKQLPEDLNAVIRYRYFVGADNWRTADALYLSESTVRRYIKRAFEYFESEENAEPAARPPEGP